MQTRTPLASNGASLMKTLNVVLGLITRDNDYQREQASVAESTAQRLGMSLRVLYAENDAIAQTKQILGLVHAPAGERPDAIVVEPVGTGMPGVAAAAANAGVAWVVLNRVAEYLLPLRNKAAVPIGSVDSDNVEVGRIQGRQFAALLPQGGTVWYIEGPATDTSKERRAGLEETLPANIELQSVRGKWTEDSGYQAVASRVKLQAAQKPTVGIIGSQNDAMAMGARKAVEALATGPHRAEWAGVPFTGVDGVPTTGQVWVQKGLLAATIVTPALTGVALELLAKGFETGAQIPERTLTKAASFPPLEQLRAKARAT